MNDIERARELRAKVEERHADQRCRTIAEFAIANLPTDVVWPERLMGLMLALLALADELGIERKVMVESFAKLAASVPVIEVVGLDK